MIKPTNINILIELLPRPEQAGLIIPEMQKRWQENRIEAKIIAKGPYVSSVEVGEVVLIEGSAGKWIDPGLAGDPEKTFRFITKADIIAVIEPETTLQEAV